MSAPIAWMGLAAAVLILPPRAGAGGRAAASGGDDQLPIPVDRRPRSAVDHGVAVAVAAVAAACIAALGLRTGAPAAVVIAPATALALRRLQSRPRPTATDRGLALVLDLAAAALRGGRSLADALALAAPAGGAQTAAELRRVASLSRLGADAVQAWSGLPRDGPLAELAEVAIRSASSGSKLAGAFERLAGEIRDTAAAAAAIRAQRAGITALGPLAACFLPSFVCLGVVPVVVGMAQAAFGGLS